MIPIRTVTASSLPLVTLLIALTLVVSMVGCDDGGDSGLSEQQVDSMLGMQESLHGEREELGRQRDQLEQDRRTWDARQRLDPIIAAAVEHSGLLLACCLPLLLVAVLLWPRRANEVDDGVSDLLIEEITSEQPKLVHRTVGPPRGHLPPPR